MLRFQSFQWHILSKLSNVILKTINTANKILTLILPPPSPKTAPTKFHTLKNLFYQILESLLEFLDTLVFNFTDYINVLI